MVNINSEEEANRAKMRLRSDHFARGLAEVCLVHRTPYYRTNLSSAHDLFSSFDVYTQSRKASRSRTCHRQCVTADTAHVSY